MKQFEDSPSLEVWQETMDRRQAAPAKWLMIGEATELAAEEAANEVGRLRELYEPYIEAPFRDLGDIATLHEKSADVWRKKLGQASLILAEVPALFNQPESIRRGYLGAAALELVPGGRGQVYGKNKRVTSALADVAPEYIPLLNAGRAIVGYGKFVVPKKV